VSATSKRKLLWSASLASAELPVRLAAASGAGFDALSLGATDAGYVRALGSEPSEWARRAADVGVELTVLDGLSDWYTHDPPPGHWHSIDVGVDEILLDAVAFGARTVGALAPFRTPLDIAGMAEHYAHLCDRAGEHGLLVHFEFTPKSPIDDLAKALELVTLADRRNGGILFDTWHFYRVNPDFDALAKVPGEKIFAVQVSDGAAEYEENLIADTFRHRRMPGEGVFDLTRVLRALDSMGSLELVGPEVLSVEQFALPPDEAARRLIAAYDAVMATALR
jgi:sugar phosphate isomerase/epimerase